MIGIGGLLLGVPFLVLCAVTLRPFFRLRPETPPPGILEQPVEHAGTHL